MALMSCGTAPASPETAIFCKPRPCSFSRFWPSGPSRNATNLSALGQNLAAQLHINDSNNATSVSLANIQLTGLQSQLTEASHVNDNETAVYLNGQNTTAGVAKNAANQQSKTAIIGTVGTVAAAAIAAFF